MLILSRIFLALGMMAASAQTSTAPGSGKSPKEVVEELWSIAVQGDLLTHDGWNRTSRLFIQPEPPPRNKEFKVMSNSYGVMSSTIKGHSAEVVLEFDCAGRIDSALRYTPPPKSQFVKTGLVYRLAFGPTPMRMYGPDGKTLIEEKMTGSSEWRIEGS